MPRKPKSPWGDLLGEPIERMWPRHNPTYGDASEQDAKVEQYRKMLRLKEHYGIERETGWRPWYELALALALEHDDGLNIVDPLPLPTHKTAPRWNVEGELLLKEIDALRGKYGQDAKLEFLLAKREEYRQLYRPNYQPMNIGTLKARYHEAVRRRRKSTKPSTN